MRRKPWWVCATLWIALLLGTTSCNRHATIVGTPAQIDQIITKLDAIDQRLAATVDLVDRAFFVAGLVLPFLLPLIWLTLRRSYMSVRRRCLWGAIVPVVAALIIGLVFALWPAAWKTVGVDPLYVKVVDATTNPALKSVLTTDQTQNVLAMRRQTKGSYVLGKRGSFVLESPVLVILSMAGAAILGALAAYILFKILPNIYTAARRYQKRTGARA
jgi:hypothetical protein